MSISSASSCYFILSACNNNNNNNQNSVVAYGGNFPGAGGRSHQCSMFTKTLIE